MDKKGDAEAAVLDCLVSSALATDRKGSQPSRMGEGRPKGAADPTRGTERKTSERTVNRKIAKLYV